jgi:hypothetical protein
MPYEVGVSTADAVSTWSGWAVNRMIFTDGLLRRMGCTASEPNMSGRAQVEQDDVRTQRVDRGHRWVESRVDGRRFMPGAGVALTCSQEVCWMHLPSCGASRIAYAGYAA